MTITARSPEPTPYEREVAQYPTGSHRHHGATIYACCTSLIGPVCKHRQGSR